MLRNRALTLLFLLGLLVTTSLAAGPRVDPDECEIPEREPNPNASWMEGAVQAVSLAVVCPCVGFIFIVIKFFGVLGNSPGKEGSEQRRISEAIMEGSYAFMWRQYKIIGIFVLIIFILILALLPAPCDPYAGHAGQQTTQVYWVMALHFLIGAGLSSLSGVVGMNMAIRANVRTTEACKDPANGLNRGLRVAFDSGTVMGMSVVCFVVFGQAILFWIFEDPLALSGFGFGASIVALFARVGGGIFTKAADVGSDLVGKVESGLPEDDPRNPGVIADNVGDNVGDVAGLGADLFESYVGATVAAVPLGYHDYGMSGVALPFWISGMGIICSIIGSFFVRTKNDASASDLLHSLHMGTYIASFLVLCGSIPICYYLFENDTATGWELYACLVIGLFSGNLVGWFTEYTTSDAYFPTRSIALSARTGPATVIISGFGVGMISTLAPGVILAFTALGVSLLQGPYGVAIAAVGMLSTLGITLATDAYGPVADNAGGIAEMAGLPSDVRERTDKLDALGNTTAATGKGFAIGSALLITLALISAYTVETSDFEGKPITLAFEDPYVLSGSLIGALLPFLFAALTMFAVGRSAQSLIVEVRRQFREIPGLREGREGVKPDNNTCVDICTTAALKEMVLPGVISIASPLVFGFIFGSRFLGGILVGTILSGFFLATTMANAGGAWDNAKKFIEAGRANQYDVPPKFNGNLPDGVKLNPNAANWSNHEVLIWANSCGFGTWASLFQQHNVTGETLFQKEPEGYSKFGIQDHGVQQLIHKKVSELHMGKRSSYHDATVIGDTVGDPFKDTSGPALNILSKLMSHLALVIAGELKYDTAEWRAGIIILAVFVLIIGFYYYFCDPKPASVDDYDENAIEMTSGNVSADDFKNAANSGY